MNNKISRYLAISLSVLFGALFVSMNQTFAQFSTGDWSSDDPYHITSCEELQEVNNHMGDSFVLMFEADTLDCSSLGNDVMIGGTGGTSSSWVGTSFTGSFNGNDKTIIIAIDTDSTRAWLFRSVAGGTIIDTNVDGVLTWSNRAWWLVGYMSGTIISGSSSLVDIRGWGNSNFAIGWLVGWSVNSEIYNSFYSGTIITQWNVTDVWWLVGLANQGILIDNSYTLGSINTRARAWGIIWGTAIGSTIRNSYAMLSLTWTRWVWWILWFTSDTALIENSYFSWNLYASISDIGGILWSTLTSSDTTISSSYALGNITSAGINPGGIIGSTSANSTILVTWSYFAWNILGPDWIGGIIGSSNGAITVSNSYVAAHITWNNNLGVGGIMWYGPDATIINSYVIWTVNGPSYIGWLVGYGVDVIATNSYVAALVTGSSVVGWLIWFIDGGTTDVTASYRDLLSGSNVSTNAWGWSGLSTAEMKSFDTFVDAEWNIQASAIEKNDWYPFLSREVDANSPTWFITHPILGCTDSDANNYDEEANTDNGSCTYPQPTQSSWGGWWGWLTMDYCPDGDFSGSYYDGSCGPAMTLVQKVVANLAVRWASLSDQQIQNTLDNLVFLNNKIQTMDTISDSMKELFQAIVDALLDHYDDV